MNDIKSCLVYKCSITMKIDVNVGVLDQSILKWYDSASTEEITNALYHGYRIVSDPSYKERLEGSDETVLLKQSIEMYKSQLKEAMESYSDRLNGEQEKIKVRYEAEFMNRLNEKENRINEIQSVMIPQLLSDKERLIKEKAERIEVQKKLLNGLEIELSTMRERCNELESIMSNSSKKGAYAENKLNELLATNLSNEVSVDLKSSKKHSADIHITSKEYGGVVLIESKFYSDKYKKNIYDEIDKFYKDIDNCKERMEVFSAIFVSYTCDIPNITDNFKCIVERGIRCYYFANMTEEKFNLLYRVIELEHMFYRQQKTIEGNESMTKYLMRSFNEICLNYKKIEELSPGYSAIKKAVEKEESRYSKALTKIVSDIKLKSDTFMKLTNIDSVNSIEVCDLLAIESPHSMNMPQWNSFKEEMVQIRVDKNELMKTRDSLNSLEVIFDEKQKIISENESKILDLEKKLQTKAKRAKKVKEPTRNVD